MIIARSSAHNLGQIGGKRDRATEVCSLHIARSDGEADSQDGLKCEQLTKNTVLITVSGPDRTGITAGLIEMIQSFDHSIIDIGQAITHGLLSLSFLLETKGEISPLINNLKGHTRDKNLHLTWQKFTGRPPFTQHNGEKFVLSCVASQAPLSAAFLASLAQTLARHQINILRIDNLHPPHFKALEMATLAPPGLNINAVKSELLNLSTRHRADLALIKDNIFRHSKRLIAFDMDSTLIQTEIIDEMAAQLGRADEVHQLTERAMNGELDFEQSLRARVAKLKGLPVSDMQKILEKLPFTPGTETFIHTVQKLGYKLALISGGFSYFADALKIKWNLDYAFANQLEIRDGHLTGHLKNEVVVDAHQKALLLKTIAQQEKIGLEQVVAVGDGANDLEMLATAGLGIAFHAKDKVRRKAHQNMSYGPMTTLFYFLGIAELAHPS